MVRLARDDDEWGFSRRFNSINGKEMLQVSSARVLGFDGIKLIYFRASDGFVLVWRDALCVSLPRGHTDYILEPSDMETSVAQNC